MIFLIDNQLPPALVEYFQRHGLEALHVCQCNLEQSSDRQIWDYAKSHGYAIVSKDEDSLHLSGSDEHGPPMIWVRLGNCRNTALIAAFDSVMTGLKESVSRGARVVEIR